jgi:hypothetical protein
MNISSTAFFGRIVLHVGINISEECASSVFGAKEDNSQQFPPTRCFCLRRYMMSYPR